MGTKHRERKFQDVYGVAQPIGGEWTREILNNYRKYRVVNMELTEEIERAVLVQRNEDFEDEEERIMEARERTSMGG